MALPPSEAGQDAKNAQEFDSVRLFLQRAHQARPGFSLDVRTTPAVVRLCRLVDGTPLGILLAAAWVEHFSPDEIAAETGSSLDFLSSSLRDADPRHSGLRAVFEVVAQTAGPEPEADLPEAVRVPGWF